MTRVKKGKVKIQENDFDAEPCLTADDNHGDADKQWILWHRVHGLSILAGILTHYREGGYAVKHSNSISVRYVFPDSQVTFNKK